jgi:hypothetical protein
MKKMNKMEAAMLKGMDQISKMLGPDYEVVCMVVSRRKEDPDRICSTTTLSTDDTVKALRCILKRMERNPDPDLEFNLSYYHDSNKQWKN